MKSNSPGPKRRRPPGSKTVILSTATATATHPAAPGGPRTRGASKLGTVLANLLACFEERTVTSKEMDLIRPTHENGWLRPEIEAKLGQLHPTCPDHLELHRLVTLSLDLLTAVDGGQFNP